jgi:hypothetical protein
LMSSGVSVIASEPNGRFHRARRRQRCTAALSDATFSLAMMAGRAFTFHRHDDTWHFSPTPRYPTLHPAPRQLVMQPSKALRSATLEHHPRTDLSNTDGAAIPPLDVGDDSPRRIASAASPHADAWLGPATKAIPQLLRKPKPSYVVGRASRDDLRREKS